MTLGACLLNNDLDQDLRDKILTARVNGKSWKDIGETYDIGSPSAARKKFTLLTGIDNYKVKGDDLLTLAKGKMPTNLPDLDVPKRKPLNNPTPKPDVPDVDATPIKIKTVADIEDRKALEILDRPDGSKRRLPIDPKEDDRIRRQVIKAGIKDDDRIEQIVQVNRALRHKYDQGFTTIEKVRPDVTGNLSLSSTMAYIRNGEFLGLNPRVLKGSTILKEEKSGWSAKGTGTISDVIVHEHGHLFLQGFAPRATGGGRQRLTAKVRANKAAMQSLGTENVSDLRTAQRSLSRYGATDKDEAEAELWMRYHMGGDDREDWVVAWGEEFHKALGLDPTPLSEFLPVGRKP